MESWKTIALDAFMLFVLVFATFNITVVSIWMFYTTIWPGTRQQKQNENMADLKEALAKYEAYRASSAKSQQTARQGE